MPHPEVGAKRRGHWPQLARFHCGREGLILGVPDCLTAGTTLRMVIPRLGTSGGAPSPAALTAADDFKSSRTSAIRPRRGGGCFGSGGARLLVAGSGRGFGFAVAHTFVEHRAQGGSKAFFDQSQFAQSQRAFVQLAIEETAVDDFRDQIFDAGGGGFFE